MRDTLATLSSILAGLIRLFEDVVPCLIDRIYLIDRDEARQVLTSADGVPSQ